MWPIVARAQQDRVRRIGVLGNLNPDDPESKARIKAFLQGLEERGWIDGSNISDRLSMGYTNLSKHASDLLALSPDVVLANANPSLSTFQSLSHTIPIVFVAASDPVNSGASKFVPTGRQRHWFHNGRVWLEWKMAGASQGISPSLKKVAVLQDPIAGSSSVAQFAAIQAVAPAMNVDLVRSSCGTIVRSNKLSHFRPIAQCWPDRDQDWRGDQAP